MNFMEAVQEKISGKTVMLNWGNYQYKIEGSIGNIQIYCTNNMEFVAFSSELIFNKDWEVIEDDKDWNLMGEYITDAPMLHTKEVKKCRDLILEDLKHKVESFQDNDNDLVSGIAEPYVLDIINKRFGDLK